jgi:Ca2+:H+ antiporter
MFSKSRVYVFIEDSLRFTWTVYIAYLLFQFWSHKHLYLDTKLKSSRLSVKIPVNSRYLTEMLSASMTMNDKRGSMHDDQSSAPSSRRVSMISSNFPPMPRFPYRNSPLNSSSEVTLTESKEQVPEKGYTQRSTDPLAEGVSQQQTTQAEHDHVDGGSLNPPWSASPMPSPDETGRIRYASPEPMTNAERADLHRSPSAAESFREPQLSWMVTLLLLTLVTIVSDDSVRMGTCRRLL